MSPIDNRVALLEGDPIRVFLAEQAKHYPDAGSLAEVLCALALDARVGRFEDDTIAGRIGGLANELHDARRVIAKLHNPNPHDPPWGECPCVHCVAHRADQRGEDPC